MPLGTIEIIVYKWAKWARVVVKMPDGLMLSGRPDTSHTSGQGQWYLSRHAWARAHKIAQSMGKAGIYNIKIVGRKHKKALRYIRTMRDELR